MDVLHTVLDVKRRLRPVQMQGLRVGFVPTMGALHDGHLSLVSEARKHSEVVVVSIFVNPTQFGPNEDLARYPRDLPGDLEKLGGSGADMVFAPEVSEIYPAGEQTVVEVTGVSRGLCGAVRPGHFRGVTTVVSKLFHIVRPDVAVFGQKDFQQLAVIRRMAKDLHLDVEIRGAPIVREPDGLAMSSRNRFLSPEDRARALALSTGLRAAHQRFTSGALAAPELLAAAAAPIAAVGLTPEYLELRSAEELTPVERVEANAVMLVAARLGNTRLIDNQLFELGRGAA
jgi:pantoate--beta-alanine ligase